MNKNKIKHTRKEAIKMLEKYWSNNYDIDYKVSEIDEWDIEAIMIGDYRRLHIDPFKYMTEEEMGNQIKLIQSIHNKEDKENGK